MVANKKKKSKASAVSARGFATVSTASKAKVAELEEHASVPSAQQASAPDSGDPQASIKELPHNRSASEQATSKLTAAELEQQLEEDELQILVEKYGDQVRKDMCKYASKMNIDKRILRGQSETLNVRPYLDEDVVKQISIQMQEDCKIHSPRDIARSFETLPSASVGTAMLDESLAILWTLQGVLRALKFDVEDINLALRSVSRSSILRHNVRSHKATPILLEEALSFLASNVQADRLPVYNSERPSEPAQEAAVDFTAQPLRRTSLTPAGTNTSSGVEDGRESIFEAGQDIETIGAGRPQDKVSASGNATQTSSQQATNVHASRNDDLDQISAAEDDSDDTVEADDPQALDKYLRLMKQLHKTHPSLTEVDNHGKKQKRKQDGVSDDAAETPRIRNIRSKIASLENDILFDLDTAKFVWGEERLELVRAEALRKKHGIGSTRSPAEDSNNKARNSLSGDEDDGILGLGSLLETISSDQTSSENPETASAESGRRIVVRDFGKWTGTNPRKLLEEVCRSWDPASKVSFARLAHQGMSQRRSVTVRWSQPLVPPPSCPITEVSINVSPVSVGFAMTGISTPDSVQAEAYVAVVALFGIFGASHRDDKSFMRLPTIWRNLWNEMREAHKQQTDAADREELRTLRELTEEVKCEDYNEMGTCVQDQALQQQAKETKLNQPAATNEPPDNSKETSEHSRSITKLWDATSSTPAFREMEKVRSQLPMWAYRDELLNAIDSNQVVIISGETGCGKSTQTPRFILEHELSKGVECKIMCTEPRRISAVSLARRVSQELGEPRNAIDNSRSLVGYAIRLDSKVSNMSRLVYATTGVMMRRLEHDTDLRDVTHLIIDEVHERTIDSDFLLIILRRILARRPKLKVILMSATLNADQFSDYFDGAPVFSVPGRTYPVEVRYLEDAIELTKFAHPREVNNSRSQLDDLEEHQSGEMSLAEQVPKTNLSGYSAATVDALKDYNEYRINYDLIVKLLTDLTASAALSRYCKAILIFLPGLAEIRRMRDTLSGHEQFERTFEIHALHSAIATEEQERAFLVPPHGMHKIVLASNIAETGITIPDVTCVIDTGTHKEMRYDERRQLSRLTEVFISRANAKQRRGRAGRVQEGLCFHLFTRSRHDNMMAPQQTPEMLRLSLQELVLRVKTCNMGGVEENLAAALDPPLPKNVRRAIESLVDIGAMTASEELTHLGRQLSKLPLDVVLGKLVLLGSVFACLDSTLSIAAILSNKTPFAAPMHARDQADRARFSFLKADSDLLTVYNAYCSWRQVCRGPAGHEQDFLRKNYLNLQTLLAIEDNKAQLASILADNGFLKSDSDLKTSLSRLRNSRRRVFVELPTASTINDSREAIVNAVISWSFYPKLLCRDGKGWRNVANNQSVSLSPTSVNKRNTAARYLSFYHIMQSASRAYNAHETTTIDDFGVALLCGEAEFKFYAGVMTIDSSRLKFAFRDWKSLVALKALRENVKEVIDKRFKAPGMELSESEAAWLRIWQSVFQNKTDG